MSSNAVDLNRIHDAILFCAVRAWEREVGGLIAKGVSRADAERAVGSPGIAQIWGNRRRLKVEGNDASWEYTGRDGRRKQRPIPAGEVNQYILAHDMGNPIFDATTFYRMAAKLEEAGFFVGGEHRFAVLEPGRRFNEQVLKPGQNDPMIKWPALITVQAGRVLTPLPSRVS